MSIASTVQVESFKQRYCLNDIARKSIADHFDVAIESYEEYLPDKYIRSYATGNRPIHGAFVIFRVTDTTNKTVYYPVFSKSVSDDLIHAWNLTLPRKMSLLTEISESSGSGSGNNHQKRRSDNLQMLLLIQFVRSMMILHVDEPRPMTDPFKRIYDNLYIHPDYGVASSEIKCINDATKKFLDGTTNTLHENFRNLADYLSYVRQKYPDKNIRVHNFDELRAKMRNRYPGDIIVF